MTTKQTLSLCAVLVLIALLVMINMRAWHEQKQNIKGHNVPPVKDTLNFDTLHSRIPDLKSAD